MSLSGIAELPVDVLATILSECDLQSVFNLTRVNKKFRKLLLDPIMVGVWRDGWTHSGLPAYEIAPSPSVTPPNPVDDEDNETVRRTEEKAGKIKFTERMTIYKWANLLFGDCQVCGAKTQNVDAHLRLKACAQPKKCLADLTVNRNKLEPERLPLSDLSARSGLRLSRGGRLCFLVTDLKDAENGVDAVARVVAETGQQPDSESGSYEHSRFGPIPLKGFERRLRELVEEQFQEGEAIEVWLLSERRKQADAKDAISGQRQQQIKNRFIELGYEERHFDWKFTSHKQVRTARPLTGKTWPRVLRDLTPILEETRLKLIEEDLAPIRSLRLSELVDQYLALRRDRALTKRAGLYPLWSMADVLELESFKALYKPADADVGPTTLVDHTDELAAEIARVKEEQYHKFFDCYANDMGLWETALRLRTSGLTAPIFFPADERKWLRPDSAPPRPEEDYVFTSEDKKSVLASSFAVFECSECRILDTYPKILDHVCSAASPAPLAADMYKVSPTTATQAMAIVALARLDPRVLETEEEGGGRPRRLEFGEMAYVSHAEMDALGNAFSCTLCPPTFSSLARNWLGIAEHCLTADYHDLKCSGPGPRQYRAEMCPNGAHGIVFETPAVAQLRLLK
ncbi:hypothetical protein JCM3766R1_006075 [Sporobolomyces carnicolor]